MSHKLIKEQCDKLECKQVIATRAKSAFGWGRSLIFILIVVILDGFLLEELIDRNTYLSDAIILWSYIQIPVVLTVVLIVGYFYHKVCWSNKHMDIHPIVLIEGNCILVRNSSKGEIYELKQISDVSFTDTGIEDDSKPTKKSNGKVTFQYNNRKVCVSNVYDPQRTTRVLLDLIEKAKNNKNRNIDRSIY